jgi:hypothetical protein
MIFRFSTNGTNLTPDARHLMAADRLARQYCGSG